MGVADPLARFGTHMKYQQRHEAITHPALLSLHIWVDLN